MIKNSRILETALRNHLPSFICKSQQILQPTKPYIHGKHIEAMSHLLEQCRLGLVNRAIINVPPRYMKSVCGSIAFPAFLLGRNPELRILCLSYGDTLAAEMSSQCRRIMQSSLYQEIFPSTRISPHKNTEFHFATTAGGFRRASSFGGALTGLGGDFIIIDDPIKADDALSAARRKEVIDRFENTILSRLDDKKNGCIILIMQRLHLDDLTGHLLQKEGWTHLSLPAIAEVEQDIPIGNGKTWHRSPGGVLHPDYESLETLNMLKESMGSFAFSAQYQQRPVPEQGEIFKWEKFQFYDELPRFRNGDRYVMSWDTAMKDGELNDYSVCTVWQIYRDKYYYLVDVIRKKMLYPELIKTVYAEASKYPIVEILFEDAASGTILYQEVSKNYDLPIDRVACIRPEDNKVARAAAVTNLIEAGRVFIPRQAPWRDALHHECMQFPNGRHDDQVDSMVNFLRWETRQKNIIRPVRLSGF